MNLCPIRLIPPVLACFLATKSSYLNNFRLISFLLPRARAQGGSLRRWAPFRLVRDRGALHRHRRAVSHGALGRALLGGPLGRRRFLGRLFRRRPFLVLRRTL